MGGHVAHPRRRHASDEHREGAEGDHVGRADANGHIADAGRFKPPVLRGLSTRSPYFHNGAAGSITELAQFYNARFSIGLTDAQIVDLTAFLEAQ